MKGNFRANVLWPLDKMVQKWIVDQSTALDFKVSHAVNYFYETEFETWVGYGPAGKYAKLEFLYIVASVLKSW